MKKIRHIYIGVMKSTNNKKKKNLLLSVQKIKLIGVN